MRLVGHKASGGGSPRKGAGETGLSTPGSLEDLTPDWMTNALGRRFPGAVVDRVQVTRIDEGTNLRAHIAIHYAAGCGPTRVFVKMDSTPFHRLLLFALGALSAEARLARPELTLPLEHPELYAGAMQPARLRAIVVMEDVTTRCGRPNEATTPLSVDSVRSGLQGLARLHAAFWDRRLPATLEFLRPWRVGPAWAPFVRFNLARALHRLREEGLERLVPASIQAGTLAWQFRATARLAVTGPQTVLHGDPHPGNTYTLTGPVTGFYDWQLIRIGSWSHDFGYFLISSLDVADRRAHERDLLRSYLDDLDCAGVTAPDFETAYGLYRAAPAFGLGSWLHAYVFGGLQHVSICLSTVERFAAAYQELETRTAPVLIALKS